MPGRSSLQPVVNQCLCGWACMQESSSWTQAASLRQGQARRAPVTNKNMATHSASPGLNVASSVCTQLPQVMGRERLAEGMVEGCRAPLVVMLHSRGGPGTGTVGSAEATTLRAGTGADVQVDVACCCRAPAHMAAVRKRGLVSRCFQCGAEKPYDSSAALCSLHHWKQHAVLVFGVWPSCIAACVCWNQLLSRQIQLTGGATWCSGRWTLRGWPWLVWLGVLKRFRRRRRQRRRRRRRRRSSACQLQDRRLDVPSVCNALLCKQVAVLSLRGTQRLDRGGAFWSGGLNVEMLCYAHLPTAFPLSL